MRSRYTAYASGDTAYLLATWHPSSRPGGVDTAAAPRWLCLEIRAVSGGGPEESEGTVEFIAHYLEGERHGILHETSRFVREAGRWYYLDGTLHPAAAKVGRNAPCPCGSGRKFKRCCGK